MERRLSAIFAADMVGYSRLMEADEIGTIERQKTHRKELIDPAFAKHRGRIVKTTGDGVLAEFPSVVDAVQCAVAVQRAMAEREADIEEDKRIQYRIGINLGDVVVDDDGDIYGDGVNVAARLEQLAEPGGIRISGTTFDHLKSQVEVGYEPLGEVQVKNIVQPVRTYRVITDPDYVSAATVKPARRIPVKYLGMMVFILLLAIGVGGWWWLEQPDFEPADPAKYAFELPGTPSIAVLPFDNLSGDPEQDYLGYSLTENIISELATIPELLVIARNSAFTYKGKPTKVQQVAEELGVRYVLEGSVQPNGDKMRIVAQLIDALNGKHLWAERYDRTLRDIFEVQDDIAQKIAEEMEVKLTLGELAREYRKDFTNPEDYKKIVEARVAFQKWNIDGHRRAEQLLTELEDKLPDNPRVKLYLAYLHWQKSLLGIGLTGTRQDHLRIAREYAEAVLKLSAGEPDHNLFTLLATLDLSERKHDSAIANINNALKLAPSSAEVHSVGGTILSLSGEPEKGVELFYRAMRLEPSYPTYVPGDLSYALMMLGRYGEAKKIASGLLSIDPDIGDRLQALSVLAGVSMFEGRKDDAKGYVEEYLSLQPGANLEWGRKGRAREKNQAFVERFYAALKEAGFPQYPSPKLPDKPSIAVLPFDNISNDAEQEFFVDGMTEDLITRLANVGSLFVIARNTMFTYKGKSVDVKDVGRDLGVGYVLEGSVRRYGDNIRINAQLIDASKGGHLWAEIYDRKLADVFSLQDEVISKIVDALKIQLSPSEKSKSSSQPTDNLAAYDAYLEGRDYHRQYGDDENGALKSALALYQKAAELDPTFADAFARDAEIAAYVWRLNNVRVLQRGEALKRAEQNIARALEIDPDNPIALRVKSRMHSTNGEHEEAIATARHAVASNPGDVASRRQLAFALAVAGKSDEAKAQIEIATRADPNPDTLDLYPTAWTYFHTEQFDKAADSFRAASAQTPKSLWDDFGFAASSAMLGRDDDVKPAMAQIEKRFPAANLRWLLLANGNLEQSVLERYIKAFRLTELPENPYGFEGEAANRLTTDEIRELMFGHRMEGAARSLGPYEHVFDENGNWVVRFTRFPGAFPGGTRFVDGRFCKVVEGGVRGLEDCFFVYRNPDGAAQDHNEFVLATADELFTFSRVD